MQNKIIGCLVVLGAIALLLGARAGRAQATKPALIITWRTSTFAPADYPGKRLPIAGSPVEAAVQVIDGGKLADLSRQTIYWYLDGKFVSGGEGEQTIQVQAPAFSDSFDLRAQLPSYKGEILVKTISIPIASPEAAIVAPVLGKRIQSSSVRLLARPYFFSVSDPSKLIFSWRINDRPPSSSGEPDVLDMTLEPGGLSEVAVSVALSIQNSENRIEEAVERAIFNFAR
ncbi:hypothetical protein C4587_01265 [Candidatus Parcubacteria bacterium]|nr:MAG: hypothetical protein C4587_01265 [Candidatus Parcubacteria bacterium]